MTMTMTIDNGANRRKPFPPYKCKYLVDYYTHNYNATEEMKKTQFFFCLSVCHRIVVLVCQRRVPVCDIVIVCKY